MPKKYRVNIFGNDGVSESHHVYFDAEKALAKAASEYRDNNIVAVWMIDGTRNTCLVNYDNGRVVVAAYIVHCGESGNEQGHFCGASASLRGARQIAGRARSEYQGDGWSMITNLATGERYIDGRTRL